MPPDRPVESPRGGLPLAEARRGPRLPGPEAFKHFLLSGILCLRALGSLLPGCGGQTRSGLRFRCAIAGRGSRSRLSIEIHLEQPAYLRGPEKRLWEHTFAETVPVVVRTGVATEDELKGLLKEMRETAENESVLIAQACLPGVVAIK